MLPNSHNTQTADQGVRSGAPLIGWEDLCGDLRRLILEKLSLRDLARAAIVCREAREPLSRRVTEERAALIANAEEAYGKPLFSTFVTAVRCALGGRYPFPNLVAGPLPNCRPRNNRPIDHILLPDGHEPKFAALSDINWRMFAAEPYAVIREPTTSGDLFCASLHRRCVSVFPNPILWLVQEFPGATGAIWSTITVDRDEAVLALGVLLAVCLGNPEALPPSSPRWITIQVNGPAPGAAKVLEAASWVPILSSLAHSIVLQDRFMLAPLVSYTEGNTEPLGNVTVNLIPASRWGSWHGYM